jgi:hypothetical protein
LAGVSWGKEAPVGWGKLALNVIFLLVEFAAVGGQNRS